MGFGTILGFYGFLALVPFILIYLFKPKAIEKKIPSLMFFMKESKQKKKFSFLRRLLTNILFLIQLLAILGLAFALVEPFITYNKSAEAGNTVFVIDSSASMQTKKDGSTRFDLALSQAKDKMNGKVSIVMASLTPDIPLENGFQTEASILLSTLVAKEASTNIKGSMDIADTILEQTKGNVVVFSDFITTMENDDPIVSKRLLNSRGNSVEFVDLSSKANNVGFVDLNIQKDSTEAWIKNFNDEEVTVTVSLAKGSDTVDKQSFKINARSKEKIAFETLPGLSNLKITPNDDLNVDNMIYISSPLKEKITVLMISNNVPTSLKNALESAKYIDLQIAEPPIIPDIDHDIVIFSNVDANELLPGAFSDLKRYAEKGGNVIITTQEGIGQFDTLDLLPVSITEMGERSNTIIVSENEITKDMEFGVVTRYIETKLKDEGVSFLNAEDGSSLIALKPYNKGTIVYYGLFDDENDFRFSPDYPIFWNNLINFLLETENINDYNFIIGERSLIDKAGFYEEGIKTVAYNFIDEMESDVGKDSFLSSKDHTSFASKDVEEEFKFDFTMPLLIVVSLLVLFELFYLKFRGDL
tara:strand:+ start:1945 stop:3702 length:1758 start_codon:yes stop_codon:yes gene_type:complete